MKKLLLSILLLISIQVESQVLRPISVTPVTWTVESVIHHRNVNNHKVKGTALGAGTALLIGCTPVGIIAGGLLGYGLSDDNEVIYWDEKVYTTLSGYFIVTEQGENFRVVNSSYPVPQKGKLYNFTNIKKY